MHASSDDEDTLESADIAELAKATSDELAEGNGDDSGEDYASRFNEQKLTELADAQNFRRRVVRFTLVVVGWLVVASTGVMITYLVSQWRSISPAVPIAFFASVVVESIGILYVIAQHLFPNDKK